MKKILAMVGIFAMTIVLAACNNSSSSNSGTTESTSGGGAATSENPYAGQKLGVSMATTQSTFYAKVANIIEAFCSENGVELMLTDEDYDLNSQINNIENFISSGCQSIIVVPFDEEGIKDTVQKAVDEGIFVLTYDGFLDNAQASLNVENYTFGYAIGEMCAEWIESNPAFADVDEVEVGIFEYPEIPVIIDRAKGIVDALAAGTDKAKIVAQQSAAIGDEGVTMGENYAQAYPNMKVICGINDNGAVGAYEAWSSIGRLGDDIGFFGADGDERALDLIQQGTSYRGSVVQAAESTIRNACDVCIRGGLGEDVGGDIYFDITKVTAENVDEFLANN